MAVNESASTHTTALRLPAILNASETGDTTTPNGCTLGVQSRWAKFDVASLADQGGTVT